MRELSLHILDVSENSIAAGADIVTIAVNESRDRDLLSIEIFDNGRGMSEQELLRAGDPFFTTRATRRIGLGLPLFKAAAERCDGKFFLDSKVGGGTRVSASFRYNHVDRAPLGDMAASMAVLVAGNPDIDFVCTHTVDGEKTVWDTRKTKHERQVRFP